MVTKASRVGCGIYCKRGIGPPPHYHGREWAMRVVLTAYSAWRPLFDSASPDLLPEARVADYVTTLGGGSAEYEFPDDFRIGNWSM